MLALPTAVLAQQLPDPTERTSMTGPRGASAGSTNWVLQSTLISDDRRIAVINGEALMVGDRINGARVLEIDTYAVRIRTANGTLELKLTDNDPKRVVGGGN